MAALHLYISTGDSRELTIPMKKDGAAFAPDPTSGSLILTVKHSYLDPDDESVIQKATGAGIEWTGSNATVTMLRADTLTLAAKDYYLELLWQDADSLLSQPVAAGLLTVDQRLTREQQTTVPVITTEDPLPFAGSGGAWGGITGDIADQDDLAAALDAKVPAPLALTAPPVNGAYATGSVEFSSPIFEDDTVTVGGVTYTYKTAPTNPGEIPIGADADASAVSLRAAILGDSLNDPNPDVTSVVIDPFPPIMVFLQAILPGSAGNALEISATASVSLEPFAGGVDGTAATALGQLAIVTTTNASGTFEDVWTCSNLSPMTWQPPGNIYLDRTDGLLYRQFSDAGVPNYELAYP